MQGKVVACLPHLQPQLPQTNLLPPAVTRAFMTSWMASPCAYVNESVSDKPCGLEGIPIVSMMAILRRHLPMRSETWRYSVCLAGRPITLDLARISVIGKASLGRLTTPPLFTVDFVED